jgi:hypothetical protein
LPTAPVGGLAQAYGLALDEFFVYTALVSGPSNVEIVRFPAPGGASTAMQPGTFPIAGLASDGEFLYWNQGSSVVRADTVTRSAPAVIAKGVANDFVIDDAQLFYVSGLDAPQSLHSVNKDGSQNALLQTATSMNLLALDGGYVYWFDGLFTADGVGAIHRLRKTGGVPIVVVSSIRPHDEYAVDVDGTFVYWADVNTGDVRRSPASGGPVDVLSTSTSSSGVVVDTSCIYWVSGGNLLKRSKAR